MTEAETRTVTGNGNQLSAETQLDRVEKKLEEVLLLLKVIYKADTE